MKVGHTFTITLQVLKKSISSSWLQLNQNVHITTNGLFSCKNMGPKKTFLSNYINSMLYWIFTIDIWECKSQNRNIEPTRRRRRRLLTIVVQRNNVSCFIGLCLAIKRLHALCSVFAGGCLTRWPRRSYRSFPAIIHYIFCFFIFCFLRVSVVVP